MKLLSTILSVILWPFKTILSLIKQATCKLFGCWCPEKKAVIEEKQKEIVAEEKQNKAKKKSKKEKKSKAKSK